MADSSANAQFLAGAKELLPASEQKSSIASPTPPRPTNCPRASPIPGVDADGPLQKGVELAMQAVWLFMDSDFEGVEALLHKRRHRLLYASEGHAAIQYLRSTMTFTREAMADAQQAAESTINLAAYYRKPRGVSSMLSTPGSRTGSRSASPLTESKSQRHSVNSASDSSTSKSHKHGDSRSWFRMDSPRQILRDKKIKQGLATRDDSTPSLGSVGNMGDTTPADAKQQDLDLSLLDAKSADLQDSKSIPEPTVQTFPPASEVGNEDEGALDRPQQRSWTSGIANVADSVIGAMRTGTQAIGITKPEWHVLKTMTPVQRHAELVHAEAYLLRAMVNIGMGDGVLALLKEGWHVRSAYATYRNCFAYIQDAYANGERLDDHFVSGTYLGMGVFNLVLSMLPAKLLRFIELVGFSADRRLGLELLAIAAGWRADPLTADLMGPPPSFADASLNGKSGDGTSKIHPCGYGLRSEFCTLVLLGYHVFLCSDLYLGYPNFPLVDVVLRRSLQQHPEGLLFMYFEARLLLLRSDMDGAIRHFGALVQAGKGAVNNSHMNNTLSEDSSDAAADDTNNLVAELAALKLDNTTSSEADTDSNSDARSASSIPTEGGEGSDESATGGSDWRQLQYLGYWEQSLCLMALGRWLEAGAGFDVLRRENNWNKAAYTYALASCLWEHYLCLCGGVAPVDTAELSNEQRQVLDVVCSLMALVPSLKRKVAGKSIPIEKFVIRKAAKFQQQGNFLMRPGLELLHTMNIIVKMPRARLLVLRDEVEREIANMAQFMPISRGPKNPYRHIFYYDDLALLLLTKGAVLSELAYPTYVTTLAIADSEDGVADPALGPIAADTLLRLLRLMPMIQRDHYLAPLGRFYLGELYLAEHSRSKAWIGRARAQWKCVLNGKPLSSPPFLSLDEHRAHSEELTSLLEKNDTKNASATESNSKLLIAPGCQVEERILQDTAHPSLSFYDGTWQISEWRYMPSDWADSRKYSLVNMIEVRTFNATNRLSEKMDSEQGDLLLP
ncbi:hypothetical protein H4R24_005466 [Coemansia sp. RSA 988]|nr:hypothetical protein H4R24_005466 [Coemansia sp. RSA 988]